MLWQHKKNCCSSFKYNRCSFCKATITIFFLFFFSGKILTQRKSTFSKWKKRFCNFVFFLGFVALTVALPLVFALHLQRPGIEVALLFLGVGVLLIISFGGGSQGIKFPLVLVYALYTKLPLKPNQYSHIPSIPPSRHKILALQSNNSDQSTKEEEASPHKKSRREKKHTKDTTEKSNTRLVEI